MIDYAKLIRDVFCDGPGAELLKDWEQRLLSNTFDKNPYQNAFNSGQAEFIKKILYIVKYPSDQFDSLTNTEGSNNE